MSLDGGVDGVLEIFDQAGVEGGIVVMSEAAGIKSLGAGKTGDERSIDWILRGKGGDGLVGGDLSQISFFNGGFKKKLLGFGGGQETDKFPGLLGVGSIFGNCFYPHRGPV